MTKTFCDRCGGDISEMREQGLDGNEEIELTSRNFRILISVLNNRDDFCDRCVLTEVIETLDNQKDPK